MVQMYYDKDADIGALKDKTIAVIGYGSQGHAHALNLKDSGMDVRVGLRPASTSVEKARKAGLPVETLDTAVKWADVIMVLLPDQNQKKVYDDQIAAKLKVEGVEISRRTVAKYRQQLNIPNARQRREF